MRLKIDKLLVYTLKVTIPLFCVLMGYYHLSKPAGFGDEIVFIENLNLIKTQGWRMAIEEGIGLTYMLLAYPLSLITSDHIALRGVNVLLMIGFSWYLYKYGGIRNKLFFYYFAFVCTFGFFLRGINDALFIVAMLIFFIECYKLLERRKPASPALMWSGLIVAFFTRELVYLYLPIIFVAIILLTRSRVGLFRKAYIPGLLLAMLIGLNLPSLLKNNRLCYDNKMPPKNVQSTWPQRQYLAQLLVNQGKLRDLSHPSWSQTDAYLKQHGPQSLPETTGKSIIFDPKLTVVEFFKDFASSVLLSLRQTSAMLLFVLGYLLFAVFKRRLDQNLFLPLVTFYIVAIFSLVIISYVETRWLLVAYLLAILYYADLETDKKISRYIAMGNHLLLIAVMLYGSFKVMSKL